MSLESQVAALVNSSDQLTKVVTDKIQEIDTAVEKALSASVGLIPTQTVKIGENGDYTTINEALALYGNSRLNFKNSYRQLITFELEAGFVLSEQVLCFEGQDLSHIRIRSVDPKVYIDATQFTISLWGRYPAFGACDGSKGPRVEALFEFLHDIDNPKIDGVYLQGAGSSMVITTDCGVRKAPGHGLYVTKGAIVYANSANFEEAKFYGLFATQAAIVSGWGLKVNRGMQGGINVLSGALVNVEYAEVDDVTGHAIFATNGGFVNASQASANRATIHSIYATSGAQVVFVTGKGDDAGGCSIYANSGAIVIANDANLNRATLNAIQAGASSVVHAYSAIAREAKNKGLHVVGGTVNADFADFSGAVDHGVRVEKGGRLSAVSANFQKGDSPDNTDIEIYTGSTISAFDSIGGTNVAVNTVSNSGIIYQ